MGHLGQDRTVASCQERFFWPGMTSDIAEYIAQCQRCIRAKAPHLPHCAPLESIITCQPMEMVALDFLTLENGRGGVANVLVITDHFSKYAMAVPTTNQTARTTARTFFDAFVVHYGFPSRIHSDQGRNFESKVIKEPNGFRAEIPYSWIFVLVWTDPNAILSLDAKSIRRDLFLIENWTSRIFGTPMLRGFSPGIKAS